MPERNSLRIRRQSAPVTTLRRSPRFVHSVRSNLVDPETPKTGPNLAKVPNFSPNSSLKESGKSRRSEASDAKENHFRPGILTESLTGKRRSARLNGGGEQSRCGRRSPRFSNVEALDWEKIYQGGFRKECKSSKRRDSVCVVNSDSSRSSVSSKAGSQSAKGGCQKGSGEQGSTDDLVKQRLSLVQNPKLSVNSSNNCLNSSEKRVTRSSSSAINSSEERVTSGASHASKSSEKRVTRSATGAVKSSEKRETHSTGHAIDGSGKKVTRSTSHAINSSEKRVTRSKSPGMNMCEKKVTRSVSHAISSSEKRVTRGASRAIASNHNEIPINVGKTNLDTTSCGMADPIRRLGNKEVGDQVDKKQVEATRKKIYASNEQPTVQGWTREQELALERAYFSAKPTPHFWKKVAKMVPGKSAHECFNKIHSDHLTPPQRQPRSRAKRKSSLSRPLSASKLLDSVEPKSKKPRHGKANSYKAVRQMLQKQANVGQKSEADLFHVLEPSLDPSAPLLVQDATVLSTPQCSEGVPTLLNRCTEQSFSALINNLSGLDVPHRAGFVSPPVLKQVKNKALHEKYIDQLHAREAKRNAAALRERKCLKGKHDAEENQMHKKEAVDRAKSSLILNARSAINQFLHVHSNVADDDVASSAEEDMED